MTLNEYQTIRAALQPRPIRGRPHDDRHPDWHGSDLLPTHTPSAAAFGVGWLGGRLPGPRARMPNRRVQRDVMLEELCRLTGHDPFSAQERMTLRGTYHPRLDRIDVVRRLLDRLKRRGLVGWWWRRVMGRLAVADAIDATLDAVRRYPSRRRW